MKGDIDDVQITIARHLHRRIAIRPHIRADNSATQRCPVCGELFTIETTRLREQITRPSQSPAGRSDPEWSAAIVTAGISVALAVSDGFTTPRGLPYSASAVASMLGR